MRLDNGLAQGKSDTQSPTAVSCRIAARVEKIKDMILLVVRYARPVISNPYNHIPVPCQGINPDRGSFGRVFDGIVQQVDHNLHQQPGVRLYKQQFIRLASLQVIGFQLPAQVCNSLTDHIIHQLGCHLQIQLSFLHPAGGKQVLHHTGQPLGVLVDVVIQLPAGLRVQRIPAGHQAVRVSHNRGQRRTQVMGYRAQQISPQALVFRQHHGFFFFPGIPGIFHSQRTLAYNRGKHALLGSVQRGIMHSDTDNAVGMLQDPHAVIQVIGFREDFGCGTRAFMMRESPFHRLFFFIGPVRHRISGSGIENRIPQRIVFRREDDQASVQQLCQLVGQHGKDFLHGFCLCQLPVCFQHNAHPLGRLGGLSGILLQPDCQGTDCKGGCQHDQEGHGISCTVGIECKLGRSKQQVKQ